MNELPEIDLEELEKEKRLNARQRMEFVSFYASWLKKAPVGSINKSYVAFINSLYPYLKHSKA